MKKKTLTPHHLEALARQFVADYCAKNQIDFKPGENADTLSAASARWETGEIAPTGNFSGMIRKVEISFELFNTNRDEMQGVFYAVVNWAYTHPGGGTNGYSVQYLIHAPALAVFAREYKGFCERGHY